MQNGALPAKDMVIKGFYIEGIDKQLLIRSDDEVCDRVTNSWTLVRNIVEDPDQVIGKITFADWFEIFETPVNSIRRPHSCNSALLMMAELILAERKIPAIKLVRMSINVYGHPLGLKDAKLLVDEIFDLVQGTERNDESIALVRDILLYNHWFDQMYEERFKRW